MAGLTDGAPHATTTLTPQVLHNDMNHVIAQCAFWSIVARFHTEERVERGPGIAAHSVASSGVPFLFQLATGTLSEW